MIAVSNQTNLNPLLDGLIGNPAVVHDQKQPEKIEPVEKNDDNRLNADRDAVQLSDNVTTNRLLSGIRALRQLRLETFSNAGETQVQNELLGQTESILERAIDLARRASDDLERGEQFTQTDVLSETFQTLLREYERFDTAHNRQPETPKPTSGVEGEPTDSNKNDIPDETTELNQLRFDSPESLDAAVLHLDDVRRTLQERGRRFDDQLTTLEERLTRLGTQIDTAREARNEEVQEEQIDAAFISKLSASIVSDPFAALQGQSNLNKHNLADLIS